jgi:hypothetical protein
MRRGDYEGKAAMKSEVIGRSCWSWREVGRDSWRCCSSLANDSSDNVSGLNIVGLTIGSKGECAQIESDDRI